MDGLVTWEVGSTGLGLNLGDARKRTFKMTPEVSARTAAHVGAHEMRKTGRAELVCKRESCSEQGAQEAAKWFRDWAACRTTEAGAYVPVWEADG